MNGKRWTAIGLSVIVFISSLIISAIGNWVMKDTEELSGWQELLSEEMSETILRDGASDSRIAVININGTIMATETSYFSPASYDHKKTLGDLDRIKDDPTIKAILLKVNSPGGGVYESAELARKITDVQTTREIPVYVVMESMAASGGYYISAGADRIYAAEDTITGSIGVIMSGINYSGLMEKYGITDTTVKSGDLKDIGSSTRAATDKDLQVLQDLVDSMYERFVDTVSEGRELARDDVYTLADGRIYDGTQALENSLVDAIGYYEDALADLEMNYDLAGAQVISYEVSDLDLLSSLLMNASTLMNPQQNIDVNVGGVDMSTSWQEQSGFMYMYRGF